MQMPHRSAIHVEQDDGGWGESHLGSLVATQPFDNSLGRHAYLAVLLFRRCLILESVRQMQHLDPQAIRQQSPAVQYLQDMGAESADRPFFDDEEPLMVPRQLNNEIFVQWFREPRIGDGAG